MSALEHLLTALCIVQGALLIIACFWIWRIRVGWVETVTFKLIPEVVEPSTTAMKADRSDAVV